MKSLLLSFLLAISFLSFGQRQPVISANTTTTGIQPGLATMAYKNDSLWIIKPSGKTQVVTANFFNSMINSNLTISSKVGAGGALQNYVPYYSSAENVLYSTPMYHISGKVGIGTTNPSSPFHVNGTTTFTGAVNHTGTLTVTGAINQTGVLTVLGSSVSNHLVNIGANTTNETKNPNTQLRINASGENGSGIQLVGDNPNENVYLINTNGIAELRATQNLYLNGGEFGVVQIRNGDGAPSRIHVDVDGLVGINTTSPSATLHVAGTAILTPVSAAVAEAYPPLEGRIVIVNTTNATFTSLGLWSYAAGAWRK